MDSMPILKLELQDAKLAMLRALDDRNGELKAMVAASMDRAIPQIQSQLDSMVYKAVLMAMERSVDDCAAAALDRLAEATSVKMTDAIERAMRGKLT